MEDETLIETGKENISAMLSRFCTILENNKYYCGVYASKSVLETCFTDEVLEKYDIWLAHYTDQTTYVGHKIWQYTGEGHIDGKPGDADLDISYFDYPPLIKSKHFNGY